METRLLHMCVPTAVGVFHMLAIADAKGEERVIASGFGSLSKLKKRLPRLYATHTLCEADAGHPYIAYIEAYLKGDKNALANIRYTQTGSHFSMSVWEALAQIPYGETISYKALAEKAGNAKAIRAAGTACGANHLILLVPCHRVVKSDGSTGEYLYGKTCKAALILHERT